MGTPWIHLDPIGGIAGDMFVAAVSEAFPAHRAALLSQLASLPMPVAARARFAPHLGDVLVGTRFVVEIDDARRGDEHLPGHAHDHEHSHPHADGHGGRDHRRQRSETTGAYHRHDHVSHAWIAGWLDEAGLGDGVRRHALGIFRGLARAESAVHGVPVDDVEFHEVGSWDSITDIVAAAFLIDAVGDVRWTCGPLPLGGGTARTAHGVMPVPAPATLHLLCGLAVVDDGLAGERVTPTGAAIVRYLVGLDSDHLAARHIPDDAGAPMIVGASGMGFGTRRLPDRPNALRCTQFLPRMAPIESGGHVDCIEFEVDDQSSEDLSVGLEHLREREDVLQVFQIPVFGKKGRLASRIHVVARDGSGDAVSQACFAETTTIGLRCQRLQRRVLPRSEAVAIAGDERAVRVKVCERSGTLTAKAEMDDLARVRGGHAERERVRRASEHEALAERIAP
jgi:uncharacterized protein (TIGR00299 family) protein